MKLPERVVDFTSAYVRTYGNSANNERLNGRIGLTSALIIRADPP